MTTSPTTLDVPVQTPESASPAARPLLEGARAKLGFVPNLFGALANAPALLEGYLALSSSFDRTSLTATERQVVLLATSFENECGYCMAAHTAIAGVQRVDGAVVAALREGRPIADARLEALRAFTASIVRERGWPAAPAVAAFLGAGYTSQHALELVLGVGLKTLSNYVNHLAETPLDEAFAAARWTAPAHACAESCEVR